MLGPSNVDQSVGSRPCYQAVFCTELKLAVTYRAKETVESGRQGSGKPQRSCAGHDWPRWNTAQQAPIPLFLYFAPKRAPA